MAIRVRQSNGTGVTIRGAEVLLEELRNSPPSPIQSDFAFYTGIDGMATINEALAAEGADLITEDTAIEEAERAYEAHLKVDGRKAKVDTTYLSLVAKQKKVEAQREADLQLIKDSLEVFHQDRWMVRRTEGYHYEIIIHYPELEIKNKDSKKHTIYDLFVVLLYKPISRTFITELKGFRTTMSKKEIEYKYMHSHLIPRHIPRSNAQWTNAHTFCLGHGTVVNLLTELSYKKLNKDSFEQLLNAIDSYLVWESLSGGPHVHMSTLVQSDNTTRTIFLINVENRNLETANFIAASTKEGELDVITTICYNSLNQPYLDVKLKGKSLELLNKTAINKVFIDENGIYYTNISGNSSNVKAAMRFEGTQIINFNDKIINYKILDNEQKQEKKQTQVAHPRIREAIEDELSKRATDQLYQQ